MSILGIRTYETSLVEAVTILHLTIPAVSTLARPVRYDLQHSLVGLAQLSVTAPIYPSSRR
jgi:hypothetical protein